jgi:hypothetical protein
LSFSNNSAELSEKISKSPLIPFWHRFVLVQILVKIIFTVSHLFYSLFCSHKVTMLSFFFPLFYENIDVESLLLEFMNLFLCVCDKHKNTVQL